MQSAVGKIRIVATKTELVAVLWEGEGYERTGLSLPERNDVLPILLETERQLTEYFHKNRTDFDLPIKFAGTEFQNKVWRALQTIPFGLTKTYGELALMTGDLKATRAVGGALNKNPLSIIIPCHRIVGSGGKLGGFAGGPQNKLKLLTLESNCKTNDLFSQA